MNTEDLTTLVRERANRVWQPIKDDVLALTGRERVLIGGGALAMDEPNDIDIYPVGTGFEPPEFFLSDVWETWEIEDLVRGVKVMPNYLEFKHLNSKYPIQLCAYSFANVIEMVDSFDFAHIQVGAIVGNDGIEGVYFTNAFVQAVKQQRTYYTGSRFPLSSLFRIAKYKERGLYDDSYYITQPYKLDVMCILNDILALEPVSVQGDGLPFVFGLDDGFEMDELHAEQFEKLQYSLACAKYGRDGLERLKRISGM